MRLCKQVTAIIRTVIKDGYFKQIEQSPVKHMPSTDERPKGEDCKFMLFITKVFSDERASVQSLRKNENK